MDSLPGFDSPFARGPFGELGEAPANSTMASGMRFESTGPSQSNKENFTKKPSAALKSAAAPSSSASSACSLGGKRSRHSSDKKAPPRKWSEAEDEKLKSALDQFGEARWKAIAKKVGTRNHVQCLQRWKKVLKPGLVKGQWSPQEDAKLMMLVREGYKNWGQLAQKMEGRTSKQCRERWCHHLDPSINKGNYTEEEDRLILKLQLERGNRWADISQALNGRTENAVKSRWKALTRGQRNANKNSSGASISSSSSSSGCSQTTASTSAGLVASRVKTGLPGSASIDNSNRAVDARVRSLVNQATGLVDSVPVVGAVGSGWDGLGAGMGPYAGVGGAFQGPYMSAGYADYPADLPLQSMSYLNEYVRSKQQQEEQQEEREAGRGENGALKRETVGGGGTIEEGSNFDPKSYYYSQLPYPYRQQGAPPFGMYCSYSSYPCTSTSTPSYNQLSTYPTSYPALANPSLLSPASFQPPYTTVSAALNPNAVLSIFEGRGGGGVGNFPGAWGRQPNL